MVQILDSKSPLVSLKETGINLYYQPSIVKDYSYLVRFELVEKIERISKKLGKQGKILIIRSVWRSFEYQLLLRQNRFAILQEEYPDKSTSQINEMITLFIAPHTLSMHATGGAVDALIFDIKKDEVLDFGTNNGLTINLNEKCYPYHPDISSIAKKNRTLLIHLFEKEGFVVDAKEYWHFDYGNAYWAIEQRKKHAIYDAIPTANKSYTHYSDLLFNKGISRTRKTTGAFKAGETVFAKNNPKVELFVRRYIDRIYFCQFVGEYAKKEVALYEREIVPK